MSLEFLESLKSLGSLGFLGFLGGLGVIASCTSHTGEGEMEPAAIGFHTHRIEEVGTRALISTTDDLRKPGFGVYGDKTVGTSSPSPQLVFENIKVSGTSWDYKPTKYWDRTATYRFVAYAPWTASGTLYDAASKQLTINGIPQWRKIDGSEIDYLVATSTGTATEYLQTPTPNGTVNLNFKHILAQLTVNISKVSDAATYVVKGLSFASVPTEDCDCVYDSSNGSLSFSGSTDTYGQQNLLPTDANIEVGTSSTQLAHYLVAPFNLGTDLNLQLSYTLGSSEPKTVPVPLGITKFESNHSYVFNLRFEAGSNISVSVTEVKNWETIEVTDDVYNW